MNTVAPGETAKFCVNIRTRNKKDVGPLPRNLKVKWYPADGDKAALTEIGQQDPPTVAVPVDDVRWALRNAPYVDVSARPTPQFDQWQARDGVQGYILRLVYPVRDPKQDRHRAAWCSDGLFDQRTAAEEPAWGTSAAEPFGPVRALHRAGCTVVVSTGGAVGPPLEKVMSPDEATGEYLGALSQLGTDYLDFEVEGIELTIGTAREAHVAVLRGLREQRPELRIGDCLLPSFGVLPSLSSSAARRWTATSASSSAIRRRAATSSAFVGAGGAG